ncbi:MAG: hypothetical protein ACPF8V_05705 [Luteibaculum sp.]
MRSLKKSMLQSRSKFFSVFFSLFLALAAQGQDSSFVWEKYSIADRLIRKDWVRFSDAGIDFRINPVVEQILDTRSDWYRNGRGVSLVARSNKMRLSTSIVEVQDYNPTENISTVFELTESAAWHGRWKRFKEDGYDYSRVTADFSYALLPRFRFELGYGPAMHALPYSQFAGSAYGISKPYAGLIWDFGSKEDGVSPWTYQLTFSRLQNLVRLPSTASAEAPFYTRALTASALSWEGLRGLNIRFKESFISQRQNMDGSSRNFQATSLNPIPGLYGILSSDDSLSASYQSLEFNKYQESDRHLFFFGRLYASFVGYKWTKLGYGYGTRIGLYQSALTKDRQKDLFSNKKVFYLFADMSLYSVPEEGFNTEFLTHQGYAPGLLNLARARLTFSMDMHYGRFSFVLSQQSLGDYMPLQKDKAEITNAQLSFEINPSNGMRFALGYLSHPSYNGLRNFYVSLSTNFSPANFDF